MLKIKRYIVICVLFIVALSFVSFSETAQEEFLKQYDDYWNSVYEKNGYSGYDEYAEDYNNWLNGSENSHINDCDEDDGNEYNYDEEEDYEKYNSSGMIDGDDYSINKSQNGNVPSQREIEAYKSGQYMMDFEGNFKGSDGYFKRVREYLEKETNKDKVQQVPQNDDTPQWLKDAMAAEQVAKQQAVVKFGYISPLAYDFASYTYDLDNFLNNTYMKMAANLSQAEIQCNRQMLITYHERLHQFLNSVIVQYNLNGNGINTYPSIKHDVDIAARIYRDIKNMFSFLK